MRPGSPPFGKVVLFGAAADVVPQADGGMLWAVPRLALGTPEHPLCLLLLPTVGYSAPYLHHRAFTYLRSGRRSASVSNLNYTSFLRVRQGIEGRFSP